MVRFQGSYKVASLELVVETVSVQESDMVELLEWCKVLLQV